MTNDLYIPLYEFYICVIPERYIYSITLAADMTNDLYIPLYEFYICVKRPRDWDE